MVGQFVARNGQVIGILEQQAGADVAQQALGAGLGDWQPAASKTAVTRAPNNEMRFNGVFIFFPMSLLTELFPFCFGCYKYFAPNGADSGSRVRSPHRHASSKLF
jgi:hypothetical protein